MLAGYDVLFAVGINLLRQYLYHEPARPLPAEARLVQLDDHAWEIGKNYAVEVGLIGDPKAGLAELDSLLAETMSAEQVEAARRRSECARCTSSGGTDTGSQRICGINATAGR